MNKFIVCLIVLFAVCCANLTVAQPQPEDQVLVVFTMDAGCLPDEETAGGVFVMGDFNNWTPCDPNAELTYTPLTSNKLFVGGLSFDANSSSVQTYSYTRRDAAGGCHAETPIRTFNLIDTFPQQNLPPDQWNDEYCCDPSGPEEITRAGSYCIRLCLCDNVLSIPLNTGYAVPIINTITFAGGCNYGTVGCNESCEPGSGAVQWGTRVDANGFWFLDICITAAVGAAEGCFCMTIDNILPVEFGSFTALPSDGNVILNWNTLSESDNSRFEIERDGMVIAHIPSQGNSPDGHHYTYQDESVTNGTSYSYQLFDVDLNGNRNELATVNATPIANIVSEFKLFGNYPNPFNPETSIRYSLATASHVSLVVFDINGRLVRELVNESQNSGLHDVTFSAVDLPSGIYYYRLTAGEFSSANKMILLK